MNELNIIIEDKTPADSVFPIRWSISEKLRDKIAKENVKPFVLIVIANKTRKDEYSPYRETFRKVIPLTKMMTYLRFTKPGEHRILAAVVWSDGEEADYPCTYLLHTYSRSGGYSHNILSDGGIINSLSWKIHQENTTFLDVDISPEFFAKEPPEWLKTWVNGFIFAKSEEPADPCAFRKRFLIATPIQLILVPPWIIFIVLVRIIAVTFAVSMLFKNINFKAVIRPLRNDLGNLWGKYGKKKGEWLNCYSEFIENSKGKNRPLPIRVSILIPPIITLCLLISLTLKEMGLLKAGYGEIGSSSLQGALYGACAALLFSLIMMTLSPFIKRIGKWSDQRKEMKRKAAEMQRREQLNPLLTHEGIKADIQDLPPEKITLGLQFQRLKRTVCRPYIRE
jgi:hypothetical protein